MSDSLSGSQLADDRLRQTLRAHLNESIFSDFKISSANTNKVFDVHRVVISSHSGFFNKCCHGAVSEAQSHQVILHDDPSYAVKAMIEFFYTHDYVCPDFKERAESRKRITLDKHCSVYEISEKYDIPNLKLIARHKISDMIANAALQQDKKLMLFTIRRIYSLAVPPSDRALRDNVLNLWLNNDSHWGLELLDDDLKALMTDCSEFVCDLIRRISSK